MSAARTRPVVTAIALPLALGTVLRSVLYAQKIGSRGSTLDFASALVSGAAQDLCITAWIVLPFFLWMMLVPDRWLASRLHRVLLTAGMAAYSALAAFLTLVEYFFFDEFNARFNTVAVDYLIYPHEVFVNIWESYPVGSLGTVCLVAGVAFALVTRGRREAAATPPVPAPKAIVAYAVALAFATAAVVLGNDASLNRVRRELAKNGELSFLLAAYTRNLDYAAYYRTLDRAEAYERTRRLIATPGVRFTGGANSIEREVPGDAGRPRRNVVIILEESLGSEFFGSLGRTKPTCTPELDRLADEGLLFTNLKASGNRTVRGMEGVLSSFPPLPGDSIVRRSLSDRVETVARVLKRDGYSTTFAYGGRGIFDGMRSFTTTNGYDRFIEQADFPSTAFATIWGVSDEDLLSRGIEEMRGLHASGQPFLLTMLTVSNHKPYKYPQGRIEEPPHAKRREQAVRYADYALGQFFRRARGEVFWNDTIFVVIADHGARVYGRQTIPVQSYRIPLLMLGPAAVSKGSRVDTLGSSLDVTPTILGRIGRPYRSTFFGRDLLAIGGDDGWAVLNHNRDVGLMRGHDMAVLGLMETIEYDRLNAESGELEVDEAPDEPERELGRDAQAIFQVADDLYVHRRYFVEPTASKVPSAAPPSTP